MKWSFLKLLRGGRKVPFHIQFAQEKSVFCFCPNMNSCLFKVLCERQNSPDNANVNSWVYYEDVQISIESRLKLLLQTVEWPDFTPLFLQYNLLNRARYFQESPCNFCTAILLEAISKNDTSKVNNRDLVTSTRCNKKIHALKGRRKEDNYYREQNEFNSRQARQASYGSTNIRMHNKLKTIINPSPFMKNTGDDSRNCKINAKSIRTACTRQQGKPNFKVYTLRSSVALVTGEGNLFGGNFSNCYFPSSLFLIATNGCMCERDR